MDRISYETLKKIHNTSYTLPEGTERIIQFGEGNFLRGFVDYFVDILNERKQFDHKVVVVQPIEHGRVDEINRQEGLYTLYLRGVEGNELKEEKRIISCISRGINPYEDFDAFLALARDENMEYIISNTTEAGIVYDASCGFDDAPPKSFPAKLTRLLYERFSATERKNGFVILSCELIDDNGEILRDCVKRHSRDWELGSDFISWLEEENLFCSTLVDRIVTGYPAEQAAEINSENGYEDKLLDTAEYFGLWVIEGPKGLMEKLPLRDAGLPVLVTGDHRIYKKRKVRILNGAHTALVPVACLAGKEIVRESMQDEEIRRFIKDLVYEEIIPAIDLPADELVSFAGDVFDRFANPFIDHKLKDIALNSFAKWNARLKPTLKDYLRIKGRLPEHIMFAFAALIVLYSRGGMRDDEEVMTFFAREGEANSPAELVYHLLAKEKIFNEDLAALPGFAEETIKYVAAIEENGIRAALADFLEKRCDETDKDPSTGQCGSCA